MVTTLLLAALGCAVEAPDDSDAHPADSDTTTPTDQDGDGWFTPEDCDDTDPNTYPGAFDSAYDEDSDCNGNGGPLAWGWSSYGPWQPAGDVDGDGGADIVYSYHYKTDDSEYVLLSGQSWATPLCSLGRGYAGTGIGDLDGEGHGDLVAYRDGGLGVYDGAVVGDHIGLLNLLALPTMRQRALGELGDIDGDGAIEVQVGDHVFTAAHLLDSGSVVADSRWLFPDLPIPDIFNYSWRYNDSLLRPGDLDGDGLLELRIGEEVFVGAALLDGGTFLLADAVNVPGLGGFLGDVSGDGRDDVWLYDGTAAGSVEVASFPAVVSAEPVVFAAIVGSAVTFVPAAAGDIGDPDQDGHADLGTGVGTGVLNGFDGESRLFRGARLVGSLDIDDADRRIAYYATRFDHLDFYGDGEDQPIVSYEYSYAGVIGGTDVFPTP